MAAKSMEEWKKDIENMEERNEQRRELVMNLFNDKKPIGKCKGDIGSKNLTEEIQEEPFESAMSEDGPISELSGSEESMELSDELLGDS